MPPPRQPVNVAPEQSAPWRWSIRDLRAGQQARHPRPARYQRDFDAGVGAARGIAAKRRISGPTKSLLIRSAASASR